MPIAERAPLSRARVVECALELIDEGGPDALTMRKLGANLGVEAMSLYYYVESKDDLLDGVASRLLELVDVPDPPAADWRAQMRAIASGVRRVGHRHPRAFPLLATRRRATLDSWAPIVGGYAEAQRAGFETRASVQVVHTFASFLVGFVLLEIGALGEGAKAVPLRPEDVPEDRPLLQGYVTAAAQSSFDEQFDAGLELLIAGMERLLTTA